MSCRWRQRLSRVLFVATMFLPLTGLRAAESSAAPTTSAVEEQKNAMAKLAVMIGDWKGTGWITMPQGRVDFHGGERVQAKLNGLALLVEGSFFHKDPKTSNDVPSHTTLGVISFEPATKKYRFRTWLATGTAGDHELKLTDDGWSWEIVHPRGRIRYTTSFADGAWVEMGERSADGVSWQKFFEMQLRKSG